MEQNRFLEHRCLFRSSNFWVEWEEGVWNRIVALFPGLVPLFQFSRRAWQGCLLVMEVALPNVNKLGSFKTLFCFAIAGANLLGFDLIRRETLS